MRRMAVGHRRSGLGERGGCRRQGEQTDQPCILHRCHHLYLRVERPCGALRLRTGRTWLRTVWTEREVAHRAKRIFSRAGLERDDFVFESSSQRIAPLELPNGLGTCLGPSATGGVKYQLWRTAISIARRPASSASAKEANVANDDSPHAGLSDRPMMKPHRPVPRDWSIIRKIGSGSLMTSDMGCSPGIVIKSGRCDR